ncbi:MAG: hypothetical protein ACX93P_06535 [Roseovarius sp.]|nr:hypothetical protein [Roseovarius sp.]
MSSFDRRQILVGGLAASATTLIAATGCGVLAFGERPGQLAHLRNAVAINPSTGRGAELMAIALETRLGRSDRNARYGLFYALKHDERPVRMTRDLFTARDTLKGEMIYALNDLQGGVVLTSGKVAAHGADLFAHLADRVVARLIAASRALPA